MFDSSISTEDAIGKQFRIKKKNKNGSVSSLEIKVLKSGQYSINIEVLNHGEIIEGTFGNEMLIESWLDKKDILEAIPLNQ